MLDNAEKIHQLSMQIMEKTGMLFHHPDAVSILKEHGIRMEGHVAYFTEDQLMYWIHKAPANIDLFAEDPRYHVALGGRRSYSAPPSGSPQISDQTGEKRPALAEDYVKLVKLFEANPKYRINGGIVVFPDDVPVDNACLMMYYAAYTHSDKALMTGTGNYGELEALMQMEMADDEPDVVIGCFGGGSNFAGIGFPFLRRNFREGKRIRVVAVEPASCPKLTRGAFQYDFGDTAGLTPLLPMYTLGHEFQPADIHSGGLRYHGAGSIVSQLLRDGHIEAQSVAQTEALGAGVLFARTEGIIPAPESTHAIAAAVREALRAREEGRPRTILFNLSGHGMIDLYAYQQYLAGALKDHAPTDREIARTVGRLERIL